MNFGFVPLASASNTEPRTFCKTFERAQVDDGIEYAHDVVNGKIVACKNVINTCKRFLKDLDKSNKKEWEIEFSYARAQHVLKFAQTYCCHVKGRLKGKPVDLMDFHIFILINIFGFIRPLRNEETGEHLYDKNFVIDEKTGQKLLDAEGYPLIEKEYIWVRRFKSAGVVVARKNAKSFFASLVSLYMLFFDGEGGAEVYSAATKKDQARIVFDDAREMVRSSDALKMFLEENKQAIFHIPTYSTFKPLSSKDDTLDGLNSHCIIMDEVHAYKNRNLYEVLETSTGARDQPLLLFVTTAGEVLDGILVEKCEYGRKINENVIQDDSFFFIFYTLDAEDIADDAPVSIYENEKAWFKANPGIGGARKLSDIRDKAVSSLNEPKARPNFMTKYLDLFVAGGAPWMKMDKWFACTPVNAKACDYYMGIDLANKVDLCAAVKYFVASESGAYAGHASCELKLWLPRGRLADVSDQMRVRYLQWEQAGALTITEGNAVDHDLILQDILEWIGPTKDKLIECGYDSWQATQFAIKAGIEGVPMVEVSQTTKSLSEALRHVESLVYSGKFHHDSNPAMDWMMSNVNVNEDKNENIFPFKSTLEAKIDGPGALFNAVARAIRQEQEFVIPVLNQSRLGNL